MLRFASIALILLSTAGGARGDAPGANTDPKPQQLGEEPLKFRENESGKPGLSRGVKPSTIEPSRTEAALKLTVVDREKGPIPGIVVSFTDPDGKAYYTEETDAKGYAEVLVPVGKTYEVVYLSLGRREISAKLPVDDSPKQTIRLTLRYKKYVEREEGKPAPRFTLDGVEFDTGKATLRPESYPRIQSVLEYMQHKKSARIEISGHTDNVGNPRANQKLSERRAKAVRKYLVRKGIDGDRIEAVGYGETRPIASNDTPEGRQRNRRIEAQELWRVREAPGGKSGGKSGGK
ncbi:MAG: OmpA family protein [Myxococcales bacterium]|jgi:outer membrane protein OmpA-like peptidoglycan-associated protein